MKPEYRLASTDDIEEILSLHTRYQVDTISEEDKADGFITTAFTAEQLQALIEDEQGLFIATLNKKIVAYAMSASWQFWSIWPIFAYMITDLPRQQYQGITLSVDNSYQYGPVCVDKDIRGQGLFEGIFEFARAEMAKRYDVLVTFINQTNTRSYAAHTRKTCLEVLKPFEFNNNQYYELVCLTR